MDDYAAADRASADASVPTAHQGRLVRALILFRQHDGKYTLGNGRI